VLGIHLEGPWINSGAAGAQPSASIRPFDARHDAELLARAEGSIRMVTFAPEISGAKALLAALEQRGIVPALGHSLASIDDANDAMTRGAQHVTHLFNAMGPLHHRAPGLAGAALADDRVTCDLICDGVHVHPTMVRAAARAAGERLCLITDRIDADAGALGGFGSGGMTRDRGVWRLEDGRLAGSALTLDAGLQNFRAFSGATLPEAVAACTLRPARVLGLEASHGTLRPGAWADFAVLDRDGAVRETWIAGRRVYYPG
jgi:N-acetylglucosamine-6-phosphate deacetylase